LPVLPADITAGLLLTPFPEIRVPRAGYVAVVPFDVNKTSSSTTFLDRLVADRMIQHRTIALERRLRSSDGCGTDKGRLY
jgi:hypothetical protein